VPYCQCPVCSSNFHINVSDAVEWYKSRFPKYEFNALVPELCVSCWKKSIDSWHQFETGKTVGTRGSEDGLIIKDEEHEQGARITLEKETKHAPFAITCGIYGWFFHTCYTGSKQEAMNAFEEMRYRLAIILSMIPVAEDQDEVRKTNEVCTAISNFVDCYP